MSGVDLAAIRASLVEAVSDALDGLSVLDYIPGSVNPPCVVFTDDDPLLEVHGSVKGPSGAGLSFMHLRAYVFVRGTLDSGAQKALDELCSIGNGQARSVPDVIEAADIAGVSQAVVQDISGMRLLSWNDQQGYPCRELSLYLVANRGA